MTKCYNFSYPNINNKKKRCFETNFEKSLQRGDFNLQNDDRSSLKMIFTRLSTFPLATRCKIIFEENKVTIVKAEASRFKARPSESFATVFPLPSAQLCSSLCTKLQSTLIQIIFNKIHWSLKEFLPALASNKIRLGPEAASGEATAFVVRV